MAQATEENRFFSQLPPLDPALAPIPTLESPSQETSRAPSEGHEHQHDVPFAPLPSHDDSINSPASTHNFSREGETTKEKFRRRMSDLGAGLWRVFLITSAIIGLILFVVLIVALLLGLCSGFGAVLVMIGNAVLRRAGHAGYTDVRHAAEVGATGGLLASVWFGLFASLFCSLRPRNSRWAIEDPPVLVQLSSSVVVGTLSGAVGSSILLSNGVDLGGLDVLHATRAGAVGGAIMTLAALIIIPVIFAILVCVVPMMIFIVMFSVGWLQDKFEEDWVRFGSIQLPVDDLESTVPPSRSTPREEILYTSDLPAI